MKCCECGETQDEGMCICETWNPFIGSPPRLVVGALDKPLRWQGARTVFVCSMSDLFHEAVRPAWIDEVWDVMGACPQHTFIVLTKRPGNIEEKLYGVTPECGCRYLGGGDYLPNVWLGVTAENQKAADERIPVLLQTVARVRFVSVEPMLGPVQLRGRGCWACYGRGCNPAFGDVPCPSCLDLDWVICGGETGPDARPMELSWARDLRDQCAAAGVPFFFKQAGRVKPTPDDLKIREWPQ